jgi:hypothetical protein
MSRSALVLALVATSVAYADPIVVTPMPVEPAPAMSPAAAAASAPDSTTSETTSATTPARRKLAVAANTAGLRFHRSGQLPRAAMRFRDATLLDPDYALAHFNLACAASRLRDVATVLAETTWLGNAEDPVAEAKLQKALTDPDLDFASALAKVRAVLGLANFDPAHPLAWLSERHGTWSAELPTDECASRSYSFVFEPDGAAHLLVHEACGRARAAAAAAHSYDGTVVLASEGGLKVEVRGWPLWPGGVKLAFGTCPGLTDAPGSCFVLLNGDEEIGPFHRGLPGISPMRARADVAALH